MNYDIEFVIPVTTKEPWLTRLKQFFTYRFLNIGDKRIRMRLLFGNETYIPEDAPVDVEVISTPYEEAGNKLFWYYNNLTTQDLSESRWFVRIDDDTITDVSGLVDNLDEHFGDDRPWYLVGKMKDDSCFQDKKAIRAAGFEHLVSFKLIEIAHEFEGAFFNQQALKTFLGNDDVRNILRLREQEHSGWGDQLFGFCAHVVKIFPVKTWFLSGDNYLGNFSLYGGGFNHIHRLSDDYEESGRCPYTMHKFLYQEWLSGKSVPKSTEKYSGVLFQINGCQGKTTVFRMEKDGTITQNVHGFIEKVGIWYESSDDLWIACLHASWQFPLNSTMDRSGRSEIIFKGKDSERLMYP